MHSTKIKRIILVLSLRGEDCHQAWWRWAIQSSGNVLQSYRTPDLIAKVFRGLTSTKGRRSYCLSASKLVLRGYLLKISKLVSGTGMGT